jgi:hypothetical protein
LIKKDYSVDCSMIAGSGFIQMEINPGSSGRVVGSGGGGGESMLNSITNRVAVYCENNWLVVQQRQHGFEVNFNRTWREYAHGFGSLRQDFWLGLEIMHRLTQQRPYELLIELTDWSDQVFIARYENFQVSSEFDFYRLSLSGVYSGNASKDFLDDAYYGLSSQNGAYFSTYDNRKPRYAAAAATGQKSGANATEQQQQPAGKAQHFRNCALRSGGGWWFNNFQNCLPVNLNGVYVNGASAPSTRGIKWQAIRSYDRNYALRKSKMKIKPKL